MAQPAQIALGRLCLASWAAALIAGARARAQAGSVKIRNSPRKAVQGISVITMLRLAGLGLAANLGGVKVVDPALVARAADRYRAGLGMAVAGRHRRVQQLVSLEVKAL